MTHKEYDDDLYFDILAQMEEKVGTAVTNPGGTRKARFVNTLKNGDYPFIVTYSAYELDEVGMPIDNLDEVPYKGTFVVVSEDHWGEFDYESNPITDPTWLDLAVLANEAINVTGDEHHVFLEAAHKKGNKLYLSFGS